MAITASNSKGLSDQDKDRVNAIQSKIEELGFDEAHFAAKIRVERTYAHEIEKNLKRYMVIAFSLMAIALLLVFRTISGVLIPFTAIIVSICWLLALISALDYPLDIMSSLLPPILADYNFIENQFSGCRPFEMSIAVKDSNDSFYQQV